MTERDRQFRRSPALDRRPPADAAIADHAAPLAIGNGARARGGSLLHALAHPSAHAIGNQARARLAHAELRPLARTTRTIQAKSLQVGVHDSPWERQADAVADAGLRRAPLPAITPVSSGAGGITPGPQFARDLSRAGGGRPLVADLRGELEQQFGHDLGPVRVHDGPEANDLNRRIHARAFTHGADVFLGAGQPDLASTAGRRLLAHELTHVIQQQGAGGAVIQRAGEERGTVYTPADFLAALHGTLEGAPGGTEYSGLLDRLGALQHRTDELIDERCFELLGELGRLFCTLFSLPPTPIDQVLTKTDKAFVATLARRDLSHDKIDQLEAEKADLEKRVRETPWYGRSPTAELARTDAAIFAEASAGLALDKSLMKDFGEAGSHIENLLLYSADKTVAKYPQVFLLYDALCAEHMKKGPSMLKRMVARKVAHHLGGEVLEYYRSIRGKDY